MIVSIFTQICYVLSNSLIITAINLKEVLGAVLDVVKELVENVKSLLCDSLHICSLNTLLTGVVNLVSNIHV